MSAEKGPQPSQAARKEEQRARFWDRRSGNASRGSVCKRGKDNVKGAAVGDIEPGKSYGCRERATRTVLGILAHCPAWASNRAAGVRKTPVGLTVDELVRWQRACKHDRKGGDCSTGIIDHFIDWRRLRPDHCLQDNTPILNTAQAERHSACSLQSAGAV